MSNNISSKFRLTLEVIRRALKNRKGNVALIVVLGFLAGLSGGIGIGAVIPLFSVLTGQDIEGADAITRLIEGFFRFFHLPFSLPFLAVFMALLFIFKAGVNFYANYVNGKVTAEYEEKLRDDLFAKTLDASWPYLLNQKSGFAEWTLMHNVRVGVKVLGIFTNVILLGTSLIMYALIAFNISSTITFLTMGLGAILFFVFKPLYYKNRKAISEGADAEKVIANYISESMSNGKAIKVSSVENRVAEKGREYFKKLKDVRVNAAFYSSSASPFFEPIGFVFIIILFVFYHRLPGFNPISFAAVFYLVQKIFSFIQSSQGNIQRLSEMTPYLQSVIDYRNVVSDNKEVEKGQEAFNFKETVAFENLKFSYENQKTVLSGLSFTIKKGEMVGLVGSSGAGKTTVADLLLRLFHTSSGKILLDGKNIEEIDIKKWRNNIGYVSQDVFLLNDSIENNIKFFDKSISKKDVAQAVELANARDFVQKLPDGLATVIGERGVKLSGGQRQRIALARALARNPEILILDEATSALDSKSELLIQKAIEGLKGKTTVLAIAHRLSTIMNSDRLLILEKGKILEEGSPQQLLKDKDSHFYKMYNIR